MVGGEGDDQFWGSGRGGIAGCYGWGGDGQLWRSGRGAIAGCHCSVLWFSWSVTTNFGGSGRGAIGGVDIVPLQCASGRGAIAGCRCSVLWWGGVTTNFEGVDVVPLITPFLFCYLGSMLV